MFHSVLIMKKYWNIARLSLRLKLQSEYFFLQSTLGPVIPKYIFKKMSKGKKDDFPNCTFSDFRTTVCFAVSRIKVGLDVETMVRYLDYKIISYFLFSYIL